MLFFLVNHPLGQFIAQAMTTIDARERFGRMSVIQEVSEEAYVKLRDEKGIPEL
jgi:hypothetical protein